MLHLKYINIIHKKKILSISSDNWTEFWKACLYAGLVSRVSPLSWQMLPLKYINIIQKKNTVYIFWQLNWVLKSMFICRVSIASFTTVMTNVMSKCYLSNILILFRKKILSLSIDNWTEFWKACLYAGLVSRVSPLSWQMLPLKYINIIQKKNTVYIFWQLNWVLKSMFICRVSIASFTTVMTNVMSKCYLSNILILFRNKILSLSIDNWTEFWKACLYAGLVSQVSPLSVGLRPH